MTAPDPLDVYDAVEAMAQGVDAAAADDLFDLEGAVRLLADVRRIMDAVKRLDSMVEDVVVKLAPSYGSTDEERTVDGVGTIEIHGGTTRKRYDNDRLLSLFAARLADAVPPANEDGELVPHPVIVADVVTEMARLTGCATPSYNSWRSGAAKTLGVDLKQYATETEPSRLTVTIRNRDKG